MELHINSDEEEEEEEEDNEVGEIKDVEHLTDKELREVIKGALESAVRDPGWLDRHGLANKDLGGAILLVLTNALVPSIRSNMTSITELAIPETILARLRDRAGKGPCAPPRPVTPSIAGHLPA